jgi:hypothetical protein
MTQCKAPDRHRRQLPAVDHLSSHCKWVWPPRASLRSRGTTSFESGRTKALLCHRASDPHSSWSGQPWKYRDDTRHSGLEARLLPHAGGGRYCARTVSTTFVFSVVMLNLATLSRSAQDGEGQRLRQQQHGDDLAIVSQERFSPEC